MTDDEDLRDKIAFLERQLYFTNSCVIELADRVDVLERALLPGLQMLGENDEPAVTNSTPPPPSH